MGPSLELTENHKTQLGVVWLDLKPRISLYDELYYEAAVTFTTPTTNSERCRNIPGDEGWKFVSE